jgi:hypothetical protein
VASPAVPLPGVHLLQDRVLLIDNGAGFAADLDLLHVEHGGLALSGVAGPRKALALRAAGYTGPLVADPALYRTEIATVDEPFALPENLTDDDTAARLDAHLAGQLSAGVSVCWPPARYLRAGDRAALRAMVAVWDRIARLDAVAHFPLDVGWYQDEHIDFVIAALGRVRQTSAVSMGGQFNPLDKYRSATVNLRRLLCAVPRVGLWRTDLAAFDAVAHGAPFASIGAGGSLRHIAPPGEQEQKTTPAGGRKGGYAPNVLVPDLRGYFRAEKLWETFAEQRPPACWCTICKGEHIARFNHTGTANRVLAHNHNAAVWNSWLDDLFGQPSLGNRQQWWRGGCEEAMAMHTRFNTWLKQPDRFQPHSDLRRWARLPLTHKPTIRHADLT